MNRIFCARIAIGQYLLIIPAGIVAVYGLWEKNIPVTVLFMLLLAASTEKLIHTIYTVTADDRLLLFFGRFPRGREILLKDITPVKRTSSVRVGKFAAMHYILVGCGRGKCTALFPIKEEEFTRSLK